MGDKEEKAVKEETAKKLPPKMKAATCINKCYNSTESILYEEDKVYEVDMNDPWIKLHFAVLE